MAAPVPLRSDFDAEGLRALAKVSRDPAQTRRMLALSAIYAGGSRTEAAAFGGVGLQTVRDWVVAFNAQGPDGLIGGKAPGTRPRHHAHDPDAIPAFKKPSRLAEIAQATGGKPLPARAPELNPVDPSTGSG